MHGTVCVYECIGLPVCVYECIGIPVCVYECIGLPVCVYECIGLPVCVHECIGLPVCVYERYRQIFLLSSLVAPAPRVHDAPRTRGLVEISAYADYWPLADPWSLHFHYWLLVVVVHERKSPTPAHGPEKYHPRYCRSWHNSYSNFIETFHFKSWKANEIICVLSPTNWTEFCCIPWQLLFGLYFWSSHRKSMVSLLTSKRIVIMGCTHSVSYWISKNYFIYWDVVVTAPCKIRFLLFQNS